tara:strand:+ start:302 stop:526 length:225 start_codon:yes stop_codon:yes gene_type:complete
MILILERVIAWQRIPALIRDAWPQGLALPLFLFEKLQLLPLLPVMAHFQQMAKRSHSRLAHSVQLEQHQKTVGS